MPIIDVNGADARMVSSTHDTGADCLEVVKFAILQNLSAIRHANTAFEEWQNTPGKVAGYPPASGFPMYYTGAGGDGDVCISTNTTSKDGMQVAIDTNGQHYVKGQIALESITNRAKQVGGEYLGYSTEILGYELFNSSLEIPLKYNQRIVNINYSKIRNNDTLDGGIVIEVNKGSVITVDGFTSDGTNVAGNPYWYHVSSPAVGFISATLIEGGVITTNLTDMSKITTTPILPVITDPILPPISTLPVTVTTSPVPVTTTPAPAHVVIPPKDTKPVSNTNSATIPIVEINSDNAADIGTDLANVAQVSFTPAGRKKLYSVVTTLSAVLTPVYALALASAAFLGGQVRDDILIGTGITLVVDKVINGFTTRLASKNVGI